MPVKENGRNFLFHLENTADFEKFGYIHNLGLFGKTLWCA